MEVQRIAGERKISIRKRRTERSAVGVGVPRRFPGISKIHKSSTAFIIDKFHLAILALIESQKMVSEGAGAAPLAAVMFGKLPVKGKKVVLVDDMIDTAGTLCNAAQAVVERGGATEVYAGATHAVLSGPAIERIKNSVIKEVILLDTISIPEDKKLDKFTILPVAPVFAEAIERIYEDKPVSSIGV